MRVRNSAQAYGAIAMALHWIVVALVLGAWLTGRFGEPLPRGAARDTGSFALMSLGLAIIGFAIAAFERSAACTGAFVARRLGRVVAK